MYGLLGACQGIPRVFPPASLSPPKTRGWGPKAPCLIYVLHLVSFHSIVHSSHVFGGMIFRVSNLNNVVWLYTLYTLYIKEVNLDQERPYHNDSTASRLLSEVKHCRARLVLWWGTTLESMVLFFCLFHLYLFFTSIIWLLCLLL